MIDYELTPFESSSEVLIMTGSGDIQAQNQSIADWSEVGDTSPPATTLDGLTLEVVGLSTSAST